MSSSDKLSRKFNPYDLDEIDSLFLDEEPTFPSPSRTKRRLCLNALVSPKGETGKTSIAMNMAGSLRSPRPQNAVLDLDPGATARQWAAAGQEFKRLEQYVSSQIKKVRT